MSTEDQIWVRCFNPYAQISYEQNNSGHLWSYSYDPRGLVFGATDPNGTTTANTYSLTGLLRKNPDQCHQTQGQSWDVRHRRVAPWAKRWRSLHGDQPSRRKLTPDPCHQ